MTLANNTPFAVEAIPFFAPDGREVVLVIGKATFARIGNRAVRAEAQLPVRLADVPYVPAQARFAPNGPFISQPDGSKEPIEVSLKYPSDICVSKRGMDVVLVAEAVTPRPVRSAEVAVSIRDRKLVLRVHGERVYDRALGKLSFGPAAPFERRPLVWELAYGGTSADYARVERANPVGRGIALEDLAGRPAPCIENLASPLTPGERGEPAGVGALATHWLPRAKHAGTFDNKWLENCMPLPPADHDERAANVAPPALQIDSPLQPGELVATMGLAVKGFWSFEMPSLALVARAKLDDGRLLTAGLTQDTLIVEPAKERIELVARVAFPLGRGRTLVREVQVDCA